MRRRLIDFHAHILPKADHGSDSSKTSLQQLKRAKEAGVSTIVATPHFYIQRDDVESFLSRRRGSYNRLLQQINEDIRIIPAAEVTLSYELAQLPMLDKLCIPGTNYILIEMPDNATASWIPDALYKIEANRELRPIIAHIDRYPQKTAKELMSMGYVIQINVDAVDAFYKRFKFEPLIKEGQIHLLGSDVHFSEAREYDSFKKAVKGLNSYVPYLMNNAAKVLNNRSIF